MASKATEILKRHDKLVERRRNWEPQWREIASYIFPRRISSLETREPGSRQTERLFDSTAIFSNEILAASIQSGITNQTMQWFSLALRDEDLNQDADTVEWLGDARDKMLLAYRQSNLSGELHELYLDLGAFGVGALLIEEHPKQPRGLLFRAIPVGTFAVDENAEGMVDTFFYEFKMSLVAVIKKYGIEKLPERLKEAKDKDPYRQLTIVHGIYPRSDEERSKGARYSHPWASCVVLKDTNASTNKMESALLHEGGYNEFPVAVPRWTKASGEVYGRSPGHTALPDVKTLNKAKELELKAWAKVIDPPMKAERNSIIGDVQLAAGGLTFMRNIEGMKELVTNPRFDVSQMEKEEIRQSIRNIYLVDQMLQLMARDRPQMTATEVQVKVQLLQQILGPTFGRLENELLNPLLDRTFAIMNRRGQFIPAPPALAGVRIEIEYEGPLIRAQRAQQLLAIERTIQIGAGIVGVNPEVFDNIDTDEMMRQGADIAGVDVKLIRKPEAVVEIREKRAAAKAQEAEMLRLQSAAEALGKAAPAVAALSGTGTEGQTSPLVP